MNPDLARFETASLVTDKGALFAGRAGIGVKR